METQIEKSLKNYPNVYVTDSDLSILFKGSSDQARYAMVKRALASGVLVRIKRGLYCLGERLASRKPHPYELAQQIYGPSYISLESALSFHGLIPEAVYNVTNVSIKRSTYFNTPFGQFSYYRLPHHHFYIGVEIIYQNDHQFFMATPWKAISDYIFCYKKDWRGVEPLVEDLRIDVDDLPKLTESFMQSLIDYYHSRRVSRFLINIFKEL